MWCIVTAMATGCSGHLMNVALRSPVSVRLDTPVRMVTEVTTKLPADNQVTPIEGRPIPFSTGPVTHSKARRSHIAVLDLDGLIVNRNMVGLGSMGENPVALFREKLDAIESDPRVEAVVLRINSSGGGVTASDIMRRDLIHFRERTGVPVVACILDTGAGGAYYVATACNAIISHPTSVVGGIGVILNLYNVEDTMAQFNVLSNPIRAGERVDAGSPTRSLAEEEQAMLQAMADSFHQRFSQAVIRSRSGYSGDPDTDFSGAVFTGDTAASKGLIDQVGYLEDAVAIATQLAGSDGQPSLLLYRRSSDRARTPYDVTPNVPLQNSLIPLSIPGLDRAQLPTFLYIWQIEPTLEKSGG